MFFLTSLKLPIFSLYANVPTQMPHMRQNVQARQKSGETQEIRVHPRETVPMPLLPLHWISKSAR